MTDLLLKAQKAALAVGGVGVIGAIFAFTFHRDQMLQSYLFAYLYWLGIALGCLGILMLHHVVGGKWGVVIRRPCEAAARTLPWMFILFIPILISLPRIYMWARPEAAADPTIHSKIAYLNMQFFLIRTVCYFATWSFYAWLLSRRSEEQDSLGDLGLVERMRVISAPGLVIFVFTTSFAFIDWIMSLEPHWFSTVFGIMFLIGQVVGAFALMILILVILADYSPIREHITPQHYHDLGNLLLAFTVLWTYLSFSQFLITWAGNLPDEIPWYLRRLQGGWGGLALFLVIFHFAFPFLLLLQRSVKRRPRVLAKVCLLMLVARLGDTYWVVKPAFSAERASILWIDCFTVLAIGGAWLAAFLWQLRSKPLLPFNDPRLAGAPRETVAM